MRQRGAGKPRDQRVAFAGWDAELPGPYSPNDNSDLRGRERDSPFVPGVSTIMFPIVFATAVPIVNTPTKLKTAAKPTANFGDNTRVDTTVAIALGASVHPLTNMDAQTSATTTMSPIDTILLFTSYKIYINSIKIRLTYAIIAY
jgi:hypothetical protein